MVNKYFKLKVASIFLFLCVPFFAFAMPCPPMSAINLTTFQCHDYVPCDERGSYSPQEGWTDLGALGISKIPCFLISLIVRSIIPLIISIFFIRFLLKSVQKEILKPTKGKITLSILLAIIGFIPITLILLSFPFEIIEMEIGTEAMSSLNIIVVFFFKLLSFTTTILFYYIFSCLIILIYNKAKKNLNKPGFNIF